MKGELRISTKASELTLREFMNETFLFKGDIHILLLDHRNLKPFGSKIPCINVNIPATVFLSPETKIIPCDVKVEAT